MSITNILFLCAPFAVLIGGLLYARYVFHG